MARKIFSLQSSLFSSQLGCRVGNPAALLVPGSRCYPNRIGPIDMESWDGETFVKPLRHPETPIYPKLHTGEPPPKGRIYDKKPFKMQVEAGKTYKWCSCGVSKTQPFCDGSHWAEEGTKWTKTMPRFRPIIYKATETKTVYWCNCKQTDNRPFCDNSHRKPEVEDGSSIFRN